MSFPIEVIGAGGNTFNEIRLQKSKKPIKTIRERNILSVIRPMFFTIRVTKDGLVDVRVAGRNESVVSANIQKVFPIDYVSFSSWGTTESKWFFDCEDDSDKLDKKSVNYLSNEQKLVENLLENYNAKLKPHNLKEVEWHFVHLDNDYDPKMLQASVRGRFDAVEFSIAFSLVDFTDFFFLQNWTDTRLMWNPSSFGGVESLSISNIWTPKIRLIK